MQHQERTTCQHKFPPKSIETEKPGFSVSKAKWTVHWVDFGLGSGRNQKLWPLKELLVRHHQRLFKTQR